MVVTLTRSTATENQAHMPSLGSHPSKQQQQVYSTNPLAAVCKNFSKSGRCRVEDAGRRCKFDHPLDHPAQPSSDPAPNFVFRFDPNPAEPASEPATEVNLEAPERSGATSSARKSSGNQVPAAGSLGGGLFSQLKSISPPANESASRDLAGRGMLGAATGAGGFQSAGPVSFAAAGGGGAVGGGFSFGSVAPSAVSTDHNTGLVGIQPSPSAGGLLGVVGVPPTGTVGMQQQQQASPTVPAAVSSEMFGGGHSDLSSAAASGGMFGGAPAATGGMFGGAPAATGGMLGGASVRGGKGLGKGMKGQQHGWVGSISAKEHQQQHPSLGDQGKLVKLSALHAISGGGPLKPDQTAKIQACAVHGHGLGGGGGPPRFQVEGYWYSAEALQLVQLDQNREQHVERAVKKVLKDVGSEVEELSLKELKKRAAIELDIQLARHPAQPQVADDDSTETEATKTEATKAETTKTEATKTEATKIEATETETTKTEEKSQPNQPAGAMQQAAPSSAVSAASHVETAANAVPADDSTPAVSQVASESSTTVIERCNSIIKKMLKKAVAAEMRSASSRWFKLMRRVAQQPARRVLAALIICKHPSSPLLWNFRRALGAWSDTTDLPVSITQQFAKAAQAHRAAATIQAWLRARVEATQMAADVVQLIAHRRRQIWEAAQTRSFVCDLGAEQAANALRMKSTMHWKQTAEPRSAAIIAGQTVWHVSKSMSRECKVMQVHSDGTFDLENKYGIVHAAPRAKIETNPIKAGLFPKGYCRVKFGSSGGVTDVPITELTCSDERQMDRLDLQAVEAVTSSSNEADAASVLDADMDKYWESGRRSYSPGYSPTSPSYSPSSASPSSSEAKHWLMIELKKSTPLDSVELWCQESDTDNGYKPSVVELMVGGSREDLVSAGRLSLESKGDSRDCWAPVHQEDDLPLAPARFVMLRVHENSGGSECKVRGLRLNLISRPASTKKNCAVQPQDLKKGLKVQYKGQKCQIIGFRSPSSGLYEGDCGSFKKGKWLAVKKLDHVQESCHFKCDNCGMMGPSSQSGPTRCQSCHLCVRCCRKAPVCGKPASKKKGADSTFKLWGLPKHERSWKLAQLLAAESRVVGLHGVHQHMRFIVDDVAGRTNVKEQSMHRPFVICGNLGVGKRTAAKLLTQALSVMDSSIEPKMLEDYKSFGGTQPAACNELEELLRWQLGALDTHHNKECTKKVAHYRVAAELDDDELKEINEKVERHTERGDVVIISGEEKWINLVQPQIPSFRKRAPHCITLCDLTPVELARVTLGLVEQAGYSLHYDSSMPVAVQTDLDLMSLIVSQSYTPEQIRDANYYLALELKERAISNKNRRIADAAMHDSLILEAADFGVNLLSRDEMQQMRNQIDAEIEATIGYRSAKAFLDEVRQKVLSVEDGGDRRELQVNLNVVVTGNPGVGKSSFAKLFFKFLRAYGMLPKDVLVECNGLDLKGEHVGATAPKVQGLVRSAKGGMLFVDEAYALCDGAQNQAADRYAVEAVRTLLTEVEANRTGMCVVLCGYQDKMKKLMRADPGLQRRFPKTVHLSDYTAHELAAIAQQRALSEYSMILDDTLVAKLARHIDEQHTLRMASENASLAVHLLEEALDQRAVRRNAAREQNQQLQIEGFSAEDFGIFEVPPERQAEEKAAVEQEISSLVGMEAGKRYFEKIRAKVEWQQKTGNVKQVQNKCYNMVLVGKAGVGKTTLARLIARFLYCYGVVNKESFVEVNGLDLKGQYVGSTAPKVQEAFADARGGVLFIDEAWALAGDEMGNADSFSKEAVRTLLTEVENNRTNTVVILAGYKEQTARLMRSDQGMPRRFPKENHVYIADYSCDELALIAQTRAISHFDLQFATGLREQLSKTIEERYAPRIPQENAALAVNLVEHAVDLMAERLMGCADFDDQTASVLTAADFAIEQVSKEDSAAKRQAVEAEVAALTGMSELKTMLLEIKKQAMFVERGGNPLALQRSFNMQLLGNPGVGKTTAARLIAKYMHAYGLIPSDTIVERNALALKGQYVGQSCPRVQEAVADAMGGVLFIDEAYALASGDGYGTEVVRTLLTELENHRSQFVCILAGYEAPMRELMKMDPGLQRRFPATLKLPNYSAIELANISRGFAERSGFQFEHSLVPRLGAHIQRTQLEKIASHNGGLAVQLVEAAIGKLMVRMVDENLPCEGTCVLTAKDFGMAAQLDTQQLNIQPAQSIASNILSIFGRLKHTAPVAVEQFLLDDHAAPAVSTVEPVKVQLLLESAKCCSQRHCKPNISSQAEDSDDDLYGADETHEDLFDEGSCYATTSDSASAEEQHAEKQVLEELELEALAPKSQTNTSTEKKRQAKLRSKGPCPMGYDWRRRKGSFTSACMKCGNQPNDGYQCTGGSHWLCMKCTKKL